MNFDKEILTTKAYTIGRRGDFKDYVDIYVCLKDEHISLSEIIDFAIQKYGEIFNDRLFWNSWCIWKMLKKHQS